MVLDAKDLRELPFPLAENDRELEQRIKQFDEETYLDRLERLFCETEMVEDGRAAEHVADLMEKMMRI